MKKSVLLILTLAVSLNAGAQSQRMLEQQAAREAAEKSPTAVTLTERAKSQYTAQTAMPAEVTWKRDIYRELDLRKEKNAALYYPEEPLGDRVNFFTLLLNLILDGKIKAYEWRLDGNELFTKDNELDVENMLDTYIYTYEKTANGYKVDPSNIPSNELEKYYIKETHYLDQLSNYRTRVTAICPVLMRTDWGTKPTPYPMFWVNYDDISPYLGQSPVMTSSYNNTTNMSLDDYFVMRQYEGDIYKTSNLRNETLEQICGGDSLLVIQERERIEKQLRDFENGLWSESGTRDDESSAAESDDKTAKKEKAVKERKEKEPRPAKQPRSGSADSERISVRR
ncbi:MAG: gliding motility protein GldN [Bacteroidaceae bacterium]|nr:gliding motility protein GldN [Bacteroidaceae bacterium]